MIKKILTQECNLANTLKVDIILSNEAGFYIDHRYPDWEILKPFSKSLYVFKNGMLFQHEELKILFKNIKTMLTFQKSETLTII